MTDAEVARAFERGEIAPEAFDHRAHLRLAWVYGREAASFEAAIAAIRVAIQQFAAAAGASWKYHETVTIAWMRLLDRRRREGHGERELAAVVETYPELT